MELQTADARYEKTWHQFLSELEKQRIDQLRENVGSFTFAPMKQELCKCEGSLTRNYNVV